MKHPSATLSLFASFFVCLGFDEYLHAQTSSREAAPAVRGIEAVAQLKERGDYESLLQAVREARRKGGQIDGSTAPDAFAQSAKLTASDGATSDSFGNSVAISGDTAIVGVALDDVGANTDQGSAHVFVRNGTSWALQQQLFAADGAAGDNFGHCVALSGDTAIVGAYLDNVGGNMGQGSAYVFVRNGTVWSQQQQLVAADGEDFDIFGSSVAIHGETAVVGAVLDDVGGNLFQGSAYVFVRNGTIWSQQQQLFAGDGSAADQFGGGVAVSGDTAIVGASLDVVGGDMNRGSVYVFIRNGTIWSQQQQLIAADGAADDQFGASVAIDGETAVIGAYGDDVGGNANQGSAHIFVRNGTNWTLQQQLIAPDAAAFATFGSSVAIDGETVVVGAQLHRVGANAQQGSAYVFVRNGMVWSFQQELTATDGGTGEFFGSSVAISGNHVIAGTPRDNIGANTFQGSAYVFRVLSENWTQEALAVASDGVANDEFGRSVALSGDTAVVGAFSDDIGGNMSQGSAYVFIRNGAGWSQQQKLTAADGAADDQFGLSVALSGDTAVIGAYADDVGANVNQGSAYVFLRSGILWTQQQKLTADDGAVSDFFGRSVAISGETAIVGADGDNVGANADQGSAYVFIRSGTSWAQQQKLTAADGAPDDEFGSSVALSGHTAVVGAPFDDAGANTNQGSAYVFLRNGASWTQQQKLIADDGLAVDLFGASVAIDGETAVIGAYGDDVGGNANQGSAYVFVRNGNMWTQQQQLTAADGAASDQFGFGVSLSGEAIVIGARQDDVGANANQGSAYVLQRAGSVWTQREQLTGTAGAGNDLFGTSVSISGDKVVAGAPISASAQGAAYFYVNAPLFAPSAAVSRKTHGGAGDFDIPLPFTGEPGVECRSSGGAHTIVFTTTNHLVSGNASVTSGSGSVSSSPTFLGNTMTVNLTGATDVQQITVTLGNVTDSFGQVLPNTGVSMNVLAGDVNGNKTVNATDVGQTKASSGAAVTAVNFRQDVVVSGTINASDIGLVKSRSGQSVP